MQQAMSAPWAQSFAMNSDASSLSVFGASFKQNTIYGFGKQSLLATLWIATFFTPLRGRGRTGGGCSGVDPTYKKTSLNSVHNIFYSHMKASHKCRRRSKTCQTYFCHGQCGWVYQTDHVF